VNGRIQARRIATRFVGVGACLLLMTSCRELTSPGLVEREKAFAALVQIVDLDGTPMPFGELAFDNRSYNEDQANWVQFRLPVDENGQASWGWSNGRYADLDIFPVSSSGAPPFRVLSVSSDVVAWSAPSAAPVVYALEYRELPLVIPASFPATSGEIHMWQLRHRGEHLNTYSDHLAVPIDSNLKARGWFGRGKWRIRSDFFGVGGERLSIDIADSSIFDPGLFAQASQELRLLPLEVSWPDSLPRQLRFRTITRGESDDQRFDRLRVEREWDSSTWSGEILVPTGGSQIELRSSDAVVVSRNDWDWVASGTTALEPLSLGDHWVGLELSSEWAPDSDLGATLRIASAAGWFAHVVPDSLTLFLLSAGSFLLEVKDATGAVVHQQALDVNRNYRITIDPPGSSANPD
jgi:hypothetical protein